jgi:hypothetical protein
MDVIVMNGESRNAENKFRVYYNESNAGEEPIRANTCNNRFRNLLVDYIAQNNMVRPY